MQCCSGEASTTSTMPTIADAPPADATTVETTTVAPTTVAPTLTIPPAPPAAPVASDKVCKDSDGSFGECKDVSECISGTPKSGLCPGAANIQCCLPPVAPDAPVGTPSEPDVKTVSYLKLGDSQTGCPMPTGGRVARRGTTSTGPCVGFVGAHIFEITKTGLPMVENQNVVVYLGSNDVRGYPEASVNKFILDFVAAAKRLNVHILAWAGPSVTMDNKDVAETDNFFRSRIGAIPYVSLMTNGFPKAGDGLHFTAQGYRMIKAHIDGVIAGQSPTARSGVRAVAAPTSEGPSQLVIGIVTGVCGTLLVCGIVVLVVMIANRRRNRSSEQLYEELNSRKL